MSRKKAGILYVCIENADTLRTDFTPLVLLKLLENGNESEALYARMEAVMSRG